MKKENVLPVLETLRNLRKETELLEAREKEKYNVGLLLKESIEGLRLCIPTFQQKVMRDDTRKTKVGYLKNIGLNLMEVCRILGIGDGPPVQPLEFLIEGKRDPLRAALKKKYKVSESREIVDRRGSKTQKKEL